CAQARGACEQLHVDLTLSRYVRYLEQTRNNSDRPRARPDLQQITAISCDFVNLGRRNVHTYGLPVVANVLAGTGASSWLRPHLDIHYRRVYPEEESRCKWQNGETAWRCVSLRRSSKRSGSRRAMRSRFTSPATASSALRASRGAPSC